jgi:glycosyltransferase involved in cell wall biosynthesis
MTSAFHLAVYSDAPVLGGAEVNLSRVIAALPAHVGVTVVGVDESVLDWLVAHRPGSDPVQVEPITGRSDVAGIARHRQLFRELAADVVQFNLSAASSCQWAIAAAATVRGARLVVIENSPMGAWSRSSALLKRVTSRRLAAHVAVGERTARLVEERSGLRPGSVTTIYHGVPDVGREPVDRPAAPTLLTVARHDRVKGIDVLLDAMALVPAPTSLVLVGDGPEGPALRRRCTELGLDDRVEFRDVPWGEVRAADLMWAFDGLVLPSRLEGFPVTIAEGMLAGLPIVATDVGSVREAVEDGVTGWVVPPEDPAALAGAIVELVSDPGRGSVMGERARAVAGERFTIRATIDAYLEMYRRVLADRDAADGRPVRSGSRRRGARPGATPPTRRSGSDRPPGSPPASSR